MGFRIGVIRSWQAKWYDDKHYLEFLQEDLKLRRAIQDGYTDAGISQVEIDRQANKIVITIYTARPGVVIGRGGQRVDEMRQQLESLVGKRIQLNIQEIRQPELDAYLVARSVAEQIERRVAYRRAMKQAIFRTLQAGAKGMRINCAGRLAGAEIARREMTHEGQVPLHTLRADIDYGFTEARTTLGRIGVKVWIYKGDILPEPKLVEVEVVAGPVAGEVAPELAVQVEPVEAAAAPEEEAKPAPARARPSRARAKPVEPEAAPEEEEAPVAEEKATRPRARRAKATGEETGMETEPAKTRAEPAKTGAKAKPARAEAKAVEVEAEPVKPRAKARKPRAKTAEAAGTTAEVEPSAPAEEEG